MSEQRLYELQNHYEALTRRCNSANARWMDAAERVQFANSYLAEARQKNWTMHQEWALTQLSDAQAEEQRIAGELAPLLAQLRTAERELGRLRDERERERGDMV